MLILCLWFVAVGNATERLKGDRGENVLAFTNGRFDLDSGTLNPHTPDWFSTVCLPYAYVPAATGFSRYGIVHYAAFLRVRLACGCELTPCGRGRTCRSLRTTSCQTPLR